MKLQLAPEAGDRSSWGSEYGASPFWKRKSTRESTLGVNNHSRRESLDIVLYLVDSAGVKQVVQTCNATERDLRV